MSLRDIGTTKATTIITLHNPANNAEVLLNADGSPMTITMYGPYSTRYRSALRKQQRLRAESAQQEMSLKDADFDDLMLELIVECADSWHLTLEGPDLLPFSREAVRSVLAEFMWVRDQIEIGLGRVTDFLAPSKPL